MNGANFGHFAAQILQLAPFQNAGGNTLTLDLALLDSNSAKSSIKVFPPAFLKGGTMVSISYELKMQRLTPKTRAKKLKIEKFKIADNLM